MALKLWRKAGEQFFDGDGAPLEAGELAYYNTGTTDLISVYKDDEAAAAHTNPIELTASGKLAYPIYIDDGADFKEVILNNSAPLFTQDGYTTSPVGGSVAATFALPKTSVINVSTNITLTTAHRGFELNVDTTSEDVNIQLDKITDWVNGHHVYIRIVKGANNVVVLPVTDELINEAASFTLTPADKWVRVTSDGAAWHADKKNAATVEVGDGIEGDGASGTPLKINYSELAATAKTDETAKAQMQGMIKNIAPSPDIVIAGIRTQAQGSEASTAGTTTRYLNTLITNRDDLASLDESIFTLPANTYLIEWEAPTYKCDSNQAALYDNTNDTSYYGSVDIAGQDLNITGSSRGCAKVTVSEDTEFSIEHLATTANASGFGPQPLGATALFTLVKITVIA